MSSSFKIDSAFKSQNLNSNSTLRIYKQKNVKTYGIKKYR